MAREAGLDLVEVSPNANPPVCRILDYGKWKYDQAKKERDARKHQRGTMVHEVRMRPRTGQHDIDLKVRIASRLLAEGDKVKLAVMFRGRELAHPEIGREVLDKALDQLKEVAGVEKPPGMEGRFLSVILTPTAAAKKALAKAEEAKAGPAAAAGNKNGETAPAAESPAEAEVAPADVDAEEQGKEE
jgi:translation initiation factor IF-3